MTTSQQIRLYLSEKAEYFATIMDIGPEASSNRYPFYILEGVLIGLFTYLWLEFAEMGALYRWLFPIVASSVTVIVHLTAIVLVFRIWKPQKLTFAKFWLISLAVVVLGFFTTYATGICGVICMIIGSYCPTAWHTSPPDMISVFFRVILVPWGITTYLLTQRVLKKQIVEQLISIKLINAVLEQQEAEISTDEEVIDDEVKPENTGEEQQVEFFNVSSNGESTKIALTDIYFIAVEDHYCKLVIKRNGGLHEELIRLSLKEALENLPSSHFAQVHRSYIVNLKHVKHIKKEGQAYQLFLEGNDDFLPASRHRAQDFLPRLKEFLN